VLLANFEARNVLTTATLIAAKPSLCIRMPTPLLTS
jgi:hypothetical protein